MASNTMTVAYNNLASTIGVSSSNRFDAHKKSELRETYNKIVKSNKDSPLYKYKAKNMSEVAKQALDIKEQAHFLKNVVDSLSENGQGIEQAFHKRIASSDVPEVVTAEYIGSEDGDAASTGGFQLEVKQLASSQINVGNYLRRTNRDIKPGSYGFDLYTTNGSYEFQYNIHDEDSNEDIQSKIMNLINQAEVGLKAELLSDNHNISRALQIESTQTGVGDNLDYVFKITAAPTSASAAALEKLGIGNMASPPENSQFLLNGAEHSSYSNTFTVNNQFSVTLNGVSTPGQAANIGFKPSVDAVADSVEHLLDAYNRIIDTANRYSQTQDASKRLLTDVGSIARGFKNEFETIGLRLNSDYTLEVDRDHFADAVTRSGAEKTFEVLNHFRDALGKRAEQASINPMNYVDKVIVSYKNPATALVAPYNTSIYAGMLINWVC